MSVTAVRVLNFMGFENSDWLDLSNVNLLLGRNSTGKSAIIRALLLLRQSLSNPSATSALTFVAEDGVDLGSYRQMVYRQNIKNDMSFWFQCKLEAPYHNAVQSKSTVNTNTSLLEQLVQINVPCEFDEKSQSMTTNLRYRLDYKHTENGVRLNSFDIYDSQNKIILRANYNVNKPQLWEFYSDHFLTDETIKSEVYNPWSYSGLILKNGFLPNLWISDSVLSPYNTINDNEGYDYSDPGWRSEYYICRNLLIALQREITSFLQNIYYLGPLRSEPKRYYYVTGNPSNRLDSTGNRMIQLYLQTKKDNEFSKKLQSVNQWLLDNHIGCELKCVNVNQDETLFELTIQEDENPQSISTNIREMGFGLSQALPILIQSMLAPSGSLLLIEQPELHLHPAAQSGLGDLFLQAAAKNNVRFLIETHSEHLLLRLRRRIAESTVRWISPDNPIYASNQLVNVYHIVKEQIAENDSLTWKSRAEKVFINELGEITSPVHFKDFFANDLDELEAMIEASLHHSNKR